MKLVHTVLFTAAVVSSQLCINHPRIFVLFERCSSDQNNYAAGNKSSFRALSEHRIGKFETIFTVVSSLLFIVLFAFCIKNCSFSLKGDQNHCAAKNKRSFRALSEHRIGKFETIFTNQIML